MENAIKRVSEKTVMLEHVLPHDTIGDLIKRTHLEGTHFRVFITVEKVEAKKKREPESVERMAALIKRLESNNISKETVDVLEKGVKEFRENFAMRNPFSEEGA
ncbi:MAG: hypothetical protein ABFR82_18115 [Nitrospirota bacterium]